ncbi:MAG: ATPase, T2SS/T4P/T4SS family, partial [Oscillospiraceae bacterium]
MIQPDVGDDPEVGLEHPVLGHRLQRGIDRHAFDHQHVGPLRRRLPQDGRIKTRVKGRELDLRVSTVPTVHGESIVMRVLDRASV